MRGNRLNPWVRFDAKFGKTDEVFRVHGNPEVSKLTLNITDKASQRFRTCFKTIGDNSIQLC